MVDSGSVWMGKPSSGETKVGGILPWEDVEREAEKLLESTRANARDLENSGASQEQDDDRIVDRDETDPYDEVIFGRRRPDSVAIDWTSKTVYVLEFKRTSDQRQDYREQGERRARVQHDVLVRSLDTVAKEAEGETIKGRSIEGREVKEGETLMAVQGMSGEGFLVW